MFYINYADVYFSRVTHMGNSVADVATNTGIRSFEKWLAESPNVPKNDLKVLDKDLWFRGVILSKKDDESKHTRELHVKLETPLKVGDIIVWDDEKWLLYQKEHYTRQTHQTFFMVKCNYFIKWVDGQGHLQNSWCYFVSSLDSKIKENFRTWNNLITPQPNKYAEILLPTRPIDRLTKFIVEEEGWYVVELDKTSTDGVMYISLTEDKVNLVNDDLVNEIGNADNLAKYEFIFPVAEETFTVGMPVEIDYSIMKNGAIASEPVEFVVPKTDVIGYDDSGVLVALNEGEVEVLIQLKSDPSISTSRKVIVSKEIELTGYIKGNDNIKLDRQATYELITTIDNPNEVIFTLESDLASIIQTSGNSCVVKANAKNKLGTATLHVSSGSLELDKTIKIIPIW